MSLVTKVALACLLAVLAIWLVNLIGPTSAQVRLDTGDLRYRWFGMPLEFESMAEPNRSKIVALAAMAPPIHTEWAHFPKPSTLSNPHVQCVNSYHEVAEWSDQDRTLARLLLMDVAEEARDRSYMGEVTPAFRLAWPVLDYKSLHGNSFLGWQKDPAVLQYCASHGYTPPPP
jgi:hypothetical protein